MQKKNQDKPITKEELGNVLHKYINPLYEKVDRLERELKTDVRELKTDVQELKSAIDGVKGIQLRMENKLVDDNKLLHDRDDAHDKKIKDHEKRISSLEENL